MKVKASEFKKMIAAKFPATVGKAKKKRPSPGSTDAARKMREEIGRFCMTYPKVSAVFGSPAYKRVAKYLGAEDLFQISYCAWLRAYHPSVSIMHPPNEGRRGNTERIKIQLMGVLPGASDLLLQQIGQPDFWQELKRKPNRPTDQQLAFLALQRSLGKRAEVAYTLFEAVEQFSAWNA